MVAAVAAGAGTAALWVAVIGSVCLRCLSPESCRLAGACVGGACARASAAPAWEVL